MTTVAMLLTVTIPTWLAILWRRHFARKLRGSKREDGPRSIIVFRLDQLGDLVLTTPLFRALKRAYPNARCTVVVPQQYKAIFTTNRNVDEILPLGDLEAKWLPARARRLASALWLYWTVLRHRCFDLAISPRWDVDECLATFLCVLTNAGMRVGHSAQVSAAKQKFNRGFDAAFDLVVPPGPLQHEVDRNLAVIETLGARVESRRLEIRLTENDRNFARELLKHHDSRRVLIAIGIGGRAASRKWLLGNYADCVARLHQQRPVQPVIICSGEEDAEAEALSAMLAVPPYIVSGVPLRAVCAVLEHCDLFVGNDSGAAHLAAAMECATIVVSRHPKNGDPNHANSPERFGPRCGLSRVVQPLSGEVGCVASCRSTAPHCIKHVTVERVVAAALELLPTQVPTAVRVQIASGTGVHFVDEAKPVGVAGLS